MLLSCAHAPEPRPAPAPPPAVANAEAPPPAPAPAAEAPPAEPHKLDVAPLLASLTPEQKVGQLMMVGFSGLSVDEKAVELMKGMQVGGVCMFRRNVESAEQVAKLNDQVRKVMAGAVPPFIAVDQEGGNVVRISERVVVLPGNMALGATRSAKLAYEAGRAQGADLKRLGFNMNLAPVLDVNLNPRNPVIGIRSFGDRAELVSEVGAEFVRGQQDAQLATVAKHFPGHGSAEADSHKVLPVLQEDEPTLLAELAPFRAAISVGLDGMMTAHLAVPSVTGSDVPATLSEKILTDILRRRLGFDGLVLTDELEMEAIADRYGVGRAAVMAVKAGADMVLVPWRPARKAEVHQALLEAVRSGEIPQARLDEAVRHVLELKKKRGVFEEPPPLTERLAQLGRDQKVAEEIARSAITLVRSSDRVFPVTKAKRLTVVTPEASLGQAIAARAPGVQQLVVPAYPKDAERDALKRRVRELAEHSDLVIVGVENARQVELVTNAALAGTPVVAVVLGSPYLAQQVSEAKVVMATYSFRDTATQAAAAALFGEHGTPGRLPVSLGRIPFGFGLDPVGSKQAAGGAPGQR